MDSPYGGYPFFCKGDDGAKLIIIVSRDHGRDENDTDFSLAAVAKGLDL